MYSIQYTRTVKSLQLGLEPDKQNKNLPDPLHRLRKTVDLNFQEIKYPDVTHIIIRITPDSLENYITINVDLYSYNARLVPIRSTLPLLKNLFIIPQTKKV